MTIYKGKDDTTDTILEFISGAAWGDVLGNPIGESNGNYNAYFGNVNSTMDLTRYSLDRLYEFQTTMLKHDDRSTAIGAYQFLRRTLKLLQAKHAFPGSLRFTPALQDTYAVDLLVSRGYPGWWRGQITDEEFAHMLSMEWASLPDPAQGGRSHYDKLAGNHSSCTMDSVFAMLNQARKSVTPPQPPYARVK